MTLLILIILEWFSLYSSSFVMKGVFCIVDNHDPCSGLPGCRPKWHFAPCQTHWNARLARLKGCVTAYL